MNSFFTCNLEGWYSLNATTLGPSYEFGFVSVTDMLELLIVKDNFYGIQLKVNHKNDKIC
jgi:hypothetical protein